MPSRAVFLDRDHTIIDDPGYITDPSLVRLLPGADVAIKQLTGAGFKIIVVTNQSGIARGMLTEVMLEKIHDELRRQLGARGAHLDAIYYCPYLADGTIERYAIESDLRKPRPGMLLLAAKEMDLDLAGSWMIGDGARDVEAGQRAGCRTVRLRVTAPDEGGDSDEGVTADFTVHNLSEAAKIVLREMDRKA